MSIVDPKPEVEFRDGPRVVPHHVAEILAGLDTYKLTYDEAINLANQGMLRNALGRIQRQTVNDHFRKNK